MKQQILSNLDKPAELEKFYRVSRTEFRNEFNSIYPEISGNPLADFWHERLNYDSSEISWGTRKEIILVILASLFTGIIAKIPDYLSVSEEFFYPRNAGFIVIPMLMAYFSWQNKLTRKKIIMIFTAVLFSILFINLLPDNQSSDTLRLSCIHMVLFLWFLLGISFIGNQMNNYESRLDYLRYNADLIVITTIILISGAILTGLTIGLFSLIDLNAEYFFKNYVIFFALPAAPLAGTYIIRKNPQLVNKVSPVIAKIFSPLVLITLVVYLAAMIVSEKDPYNDREFLITFNGLLVGVMALILFSVAESSRTNKNRFGIIILFLLSLVTIIVNGVALSAILFRISEWGITPNRLAVLGGNILILLNILLVTFKIFRIIVNKSVPEDIERAISSFLPVYLVWVMIVTFVFPFVFGFR